MKGVSPDELVTVDLGERGLAWVRGNLEAGGAFSRRAGQDLPLDRGRVTTLLPRSVLDEAFDFDDGIGLPPGVWQRNREQLIEQARRSGDIVVVENLMMRRQDRALPLPPGQFLLEGDPFAWTDARVGTVEDHDLFIRGYGLHHMTAAYVTDFGTNAVASSWTPPSSDEILRRVRRVLVDAYDADGYLLWIPT